MKYTTVLSLSCLLLLTVSNAFGQLTFNIMGTDGSRYPQIGVRFMAQDAAGKEIRDFSPSDFTVVENGINRPVTSVSCPPPATPVLSLTLTIDLSFSMTIDNRLSNMKMAATQLVNDLTYPPAATGITTFADDPEIRLEYTSNKAAILASIDSMRASGGGTDFISAFTDAVAGAIAFTANRPKPRYVVFITDAVQILTNPQVNQIITAARAADIKIFTVSLAANNINTSLRQIATQTQGAWFEDVINETKAREIFKQIGEQIFLYEPCELLYTTDGCDTERSLSVTLRKNARSVTQRTNVSVPANKIISIDASTVLLDYGVVSGGATKTMPVTLTAKNGTVNVQSITSPEVAFRILDYGGTAPPFTLNANQARTLRIQYRPVNTDRVYGRLVINADSPCHETISMSGGVYDPGPLILLAPNGGEKMFSGSYFKHTWTGVSSSTPVEVEYSTNHGDTWLGISDNVYSNSYNWRVANTPSPNCLGLVFTKDERIAQNDGEWSMLQPAPITSLAVAKSGTLTALGLENGQIKIFYPKDGAFITILPGHNGGTRSLSFSPDMKQLASAGADGSVKIWDMQTSTLLRTLTGLSSGLHSVSYSEDGTLLAASDASTAILWQTSNWGERWRHNGDSGADGAIAIAPDNSYVASSAGNRIAILNSADGALVSSLSGHSGAVRSIDIADEGSVLASGSDDNTIRIWNARTWKTTNTLTGHNGAVRSVRLSNAGVRVISGGRDNTVRVWNGCSGVLLHTLNGHTDDVLAVDFDHRLKYILSGGKDQRLHYWGYVSPLADKSDDEWEIITTVTSLIHDVPDFEVIQCPDSWSEIELRLENIGNQDITLSQMYFSGQDSTVFTVEGGLTIPPEVLLKPEDSLIVRLRFFPPATGSYDSELIFETNIPGNPLYIIPLTGRKDSVSMAISADTLYAGEFYQCSEAVLMPLILTNTGMLTIAVDSVDSSIGDILGFAGTMPRTLLPGQSDTITVRALPKTDGLLDGILLMRVTPCDYEHEVRVLGNRLTATPVASPNPVDFGFTAIGEKSTRTLALINPTIVDMLIDSLEVLFPTPPFRLLTIPDSAFVIPANDSIVFVFEYEPVIEGAASGQMFFHALEPCEDSIYIDLVATSSRKPAIAFSKTDFRELICADDTVAFSEVTVRNIGGLPLHIASMYFSGADPKDFRLVAPLPPLTIPVGGSQTFDLAFNPLQLRQTRTANLIVESDAENEPTLSIPVSGYKHEVALEVIGSDYDFGELYGCNYPVFDSITVRNTGTLNLFLEIDSTLWNDRFSVYPPIGNLTLPPGTSQTFRMTFNPSVFGSFSETFSFSVSPCLSGDRFTYSYSYSDHVAEARPQLIDFGTLGVGAVETRSFTIRNPWSKPMTVDFSGGAFAGLRSWSPDPLPAVLAPASTTTITLEFGDDQSLTLADSIHLVTVINGCEDSSNTIHLRGRVEGSVATVELPTLTAAIGERIVIPLHLHNSSNLTLTGTKSFRASLLFNRSMLWPEEISSATGTVTMSNEAVGGRLRVTIEVNQSGSPQDGILAELRCLVLLGNSDTTSLTIESFQWLEGTTVTQEISGSFTATGICEAGGKRLVAPPGVPFLRPNAPNPFRNSTELAYFLPADAYAGLRVYNSLGGEVAVLAEGYHAAGMYEVRFDASHLPSGVYLAILRTDVGVETLRMIRAK